MSLTLKRRCLRRCFVVVCGGLVAAVLGALAALYWCGSILTVADTPATTEAMVVLGGEPKHRPQRAWEVFQASHAQYVFVSGDGDASYVASYLKGRGVPKEFIHLESKSQNTSENARFTIALLREKGIKRVIIVTSWFHSRRALNCFRHYAPEIEFISCPTVADRPKSHWPNKTERNWVASEYLKLAGYWVRYGVSPF